MGGTCVQLGRTSVLGGVQGLPGTAAGEAAGGVHWWATAGEEEARRREIILPGLTRGPAKGVQAESVLRCW